MTEREQKGATAFIIKKKTLIWKRKKKKETYRRTGGGKTRFFYLSLLCTCVCACAPVCVFDEFLTPTERGEGKEAQRVKNAMTKGVPSATHRRVP